MYRTAAKRIAIATGALAGIPLTTSALYAYYQYCKSPVDQISLHHNAYSIYIQTLTNLFMSKLGSSAIRQFHTDCDDAVAVNENLLLELTDRCKDTVYGKDHDLVSIRSREEFRRKHPITTHEHYQPYIDRVYDGQSNVMFPGLPRMIATTSGTSGTFKLIPVPDLQRKVFFTKGIAITFDALQQGVKHPDNDELNWPNLQKNCKLMHEPKFNYSPSNFKVGPNSSSPNDNKSLLQLYTTPEDAFEVQTEMELLFLHVLFALLDKNLGFVESNFANRVLNFFVLMDDQWETLLHSIETGLLPRDLKIDVGIRRKLESGLKPNPQRAVELRRLKSQYDQDLTTNSRGPSLARRLWPNLHTILASETGAFQIYGEKLRQQYIGNDVAIYSPIYAATEGLIGVNPDMNEKTYVLHPKAMFYEFLPVDNSLSSYDDNESIDPEKTLFIEQLETGKEYEIIITNLTGLYRYRFGDVIRCVGYHGEAPIVEFAYRKGQFLNASGERTSEETFYKALSNTAADDWGLTLKEYTTVEYFLKGDRKPRYIVFVELADKETGNRVVERPLTSEEKMKLDTRLGEENKSYQSLRSIGRLQRIEVVTVRKGTFENLRKEMVSSGAGTTQIKQPRVTRNEKLIKMLEDGKIE
jgi:auxin responsive GH3 family protein